ncbi:hypothetical protein RSO41_12365 [Halomonas sp. I1]|uniref:hypothetical protein n=1 Tax=Halomonas sp. I1 TaxID=393536 RepID=UPI0028DDFE2E|nr:hypothetical protein [Halomonas sp. I1]MDT8895450.1 hypothetical protein [Halomonas sp. I1]
MTATTSYGGETAITIAEVMQRHDIHVGFMAPLMLINELAMAINLTGRHDVAVHYQPRHAGTCRHSLTVMTRDVMNPWSATASAGVFREIELPSEDSNDRDRDVCLRRLSEVTEQLSEMLQQGVTP